jgi:hypothetical protein|eukprot:COSAG06_NODE_1358_length_9722_cov_18.463473_5_plen_83_part_00
MLARITPPVPAAEEAAEAGRHDHPAHIAAMHTGACDYELLSLLEPHKQFQVRKKPIFCRVFLYPSMENDHLPTQARDKCKER